MGAKKGISDLLLLVPNEEYHWLAIEMKRPKGVQSQDQKDWESEITKLGYGKYIICRSIEDFMAKINSYLKNTPHGLII